MNSPWIDAKERLPEIDQKVLVYFGATGQHTPAVISYHGDGGVWRSVLFWMPIPEVPAPDPFEEWHKQFTDDGSPTRKECRHSGWQAGVQWARSHPEAEDAWKKELGERK